MLTGQIRNQIDQIWNAFHSGGVSNPLSVIEQLTFLIFIKRLDDLQLTMETRAKMLGEPITTPIFPAGADEEGEPYSNLRWSRFKNFESREMMRVVDEHVFPFLRSLGEKGSSYGKHMKDARLGFSSPSLLAKVVAMLDKLEMDNRDTKGDVYEYMLGKLASAGTNGQFRTPRHIIQLMVALRRPTPADTICDPAAGTCGFLMEAGEYLRHHEPQMLRNAEQRDHFLNHMFHGFEFDTTMLRIGSMNMLLHGLDSAEVSYRDSLSERYSKDENLYSLILANPPFKGSLDETTVAKNLLQFSKTKKTELLFLTLFLRLLKVGGRAAVIVPEGVLFGSSIAHKKIRKTLVESHKLEGIIKLPSGVFRPYAGVSCGIVLFTKTGVGGTDNVWFYDMQADGFSLDDKRTPLLDPEQLGPTPAHPLDDTEHEKNNLPDILTRWNALTAETDRPRTAQSFLVPKEDIAAKDYDLSMSRYKMIEHEEINYPTPTELLAELNELDASITAEMAALKEMLG